MHRFSTGVLGLELFYSSNCLTTFLFNTILINRCQINIGQYLGFAFCKTFFIVSNNILRSFLDFIYIINYLILNKCLLNHLIPFSLQPALHLPAILYNFICPLSKLHLIHFSFLCLFFIFFG